MNRRIFLSRIVGTIGAFLVAPIPFVKADSGTIPQNIFMYKEIVDAIEYHRFEFNDSITRNYLVNHVNVICRKYLKDMRFVVVCDETINNESIIDNNDLVVDLYYNNVYVTFSILNGYKEYFH